MAGLVAGLVTRFTARFVTRFVARFAKRLLRERLDDGSRRSGRERRTVRSLVRLRHFARDALARDLELDRALDLLEQALLLDIAERDRVTRLAGARGAADAVHIRLGLHRKIEVDDMGDVVDVEAARGDIGGDEHGRAARAEGVEGARALVLRLVAVDRLGVDAVGLQLAREAVGAVLRLGEDDGALHRERVEEVDEELRLLRLEHEVELLVDAVDRARDRRHRHAHGIVEERVGEMADLLRHRRREEHGLARLRQQRRDLADRLDKAHVEHAVRLVEHEELDLAEVDEPLLEEVDEATRRRDEDIDALLDRADLRALADAAEDHGVAERRVTAVAREALGDLRRELTRGREDERLRLAAERGARAARQAREQVVEDRQRERGGLAGAGLRDAEDIALGERGRDRLRLDRRGALVAVGDERVEDRLRELELCEGRQGAGGCRKLDCGGGGGSGGSGLGVCRHEKETCTRGVRCAKRTTPRASVGAESRARWRRQRDGIKPIGACEPWSETVPNRLSLHAAG